MFTVPEPKKIPEPVPFEELGKDKQELYKDLLQNTTTDGTEDLDKPLVDPVVTVPESYTAEKVLMDPSEPDAQDKANFLRCILGGKNYTKVYKLFKDQEVTFEDRSVDLSKKMYKALANDYSSESILKMTADEWDEIVRSYCLACTYTVEGWPSKEEFRARVEKLCSLPRPLYEALMATSDIFERHVDTLIRRAQDENFW